MKCNFLLLILFFLNFVPLTAKTIYITVSENFLKNPNAERDERNKHLCELRKALTTLGHEVKSLILPKKLREDEYDYILFINPPEPYELDEIKKYSREKCICTIWEPPTVRPDYYYTDLRPYFSKILVMTDALIDHNYFFKFFYPQPVLKMHFSEIEFDQKKLCCLIAKNWRSNYKYELYSKRREIALFFNTCHSNEFDLYGNGWPENLSVYRGILENKRIALHQYRFCICYENTQNLDGYVTEKIFDCLVSGCVPVYWGAANITTYIPKNCFIDRRNFASNEELYQFLKNMEKEQYEKYLESIQQYLQSEEAFAFSTEFFIDTILSLFFPNYAQEQIFTVEQMTKLSKTRKHYQNLKIFN